MEEIDQGSTQATPGTATLVTISNRPHQTPVDAPGFPSAAIQLAHRPKGGLLLSSTKRKSRPVDTR